MVLPVGWSDDQPAWARWTAAQVDTFREPPTWLDASIAADQVSEVIGRFLDCWPDSLRSDTLRYATPTTSRAQTLGAELGTVAAVSGLLLGCIIRMRNDVMHPTRRSGRSGRSVSGRRHTASQYTSLELALLAYIGYRGRYPRIAASRWLGYTEDVPWTGC